MPQTIRSPLAKDMAKKIVHGLNVSPFQAAYATLNSAQKKAVETIEGPVMVVAGPGTGKTQVVALRVAHILKKTQAGPGNILCLTFSTSGATAMRERLRSLIGADAYRVSVNTIHGFCNDIIAGNPLVFEEWSAWEQIGDIERYREVNAIIDALLPNLAVINRKDPHGRTKQILDAISTLKREGKTDADFLSGVVKHYEEEIAARSRPGTKQHEKNLLAARKFADFVRIFHRFQEMLRTTGRYDYDDMILHVIRALEDEDWLLAALQVRYQYILVDEFQDTNASQYRIIELLTMPRTPEDSPNLFVVADDDQAIYRFQGANVGNILSFRKRFPKAPVIALTESYRSTQEILDAAGKLIAVNTERLVGAIDGLDKTMVSALGKRGPLPGLLHAPSDTAEPWLIADLIEERLNEGIPAQEIAVLTQQNKELLPLQEVLTSRGIPVRMFGTLDLLTHPLIVQVLAMLRAIEKPEQKGMLAAALACEIFHCHPADLGRLFELHRTEGDPVHAILLRFDRPGCEDPFVLHDRDALLHAFHTILDLHQKLPSRTIVETLERLLKDGGFLSDIDTSDPPDPLDLAALQEFFDRLKNRMHEQPHLSFAVWMHDLELYSDPELQDLRMTYEMPHLTDAGVQLMTAHRSKGLEFHTVILSHFREKHWDKKVNNRRISLPEDLLFGWQKEQKSFERSQDERRVAYVAMTRAKNELLFTCPKTLTVRDRQKSVSPSLFFAEAGSLPEEERGLQNPERASTLLLKPPRLIDQHFKTFLKNRIERFALSATALEHFLEDPQKFLMMDLLQTPEIKKPVFVYGTAVHDALKKWGLAHMKNEPMGKEEFIAAFSHYIREKEILTELERASLHALGLESLPRYYDQRLSAARPFIHSVESSHTCRFDDIPLKGKIDRIDRVAPESSRVTIIDFKTGHPKTESEIRDGANFHQLVFYAILLEHAAPYLEPVRFTLDFVGEGSHHPVERTFSIAEAEKDDLRAKIKAVWAKILALDFTRL